MTVIQITRQKAYIAMLIPHQIIVDEQKVGVVRNGQTQTIEVSPGTHEIYVKQSMLVRSNSLTVDCLPDQTIRLQVTQAKAGVQMFLALVARGLLLRKRNHLILERLP